MWLPNWQCTGHGDSPKWRPPDPPRPRSHYFRLPQLRRPRSFDPTTVPLAPANPISGLCPPWPIATPSPALPPHHAATALTLHAAHWSNGADALPAFSLSGAGRRDCTWREEARRGREDATNGKSQRVPAVANGRTVKGGPLAKAPGAGSGGGLSPTGSAIEGGAL